MPQAQQGFVISDTAQLVDGVVKTADIADNAVTDAKIAAHTTTKITVPEANLSGPLAIARGGTGQASQAAAFDALAPTPAQGNVLYYNGTNWVVLAPGTSGQFLKTLGAAANPAWADVASTYAAGTATRVLDTADNTQTIAHGLGATPSFVRLAAYVGQVDGICVAEAVIVGGTTRNASANHFGGNSGESANTFTLTSTNSAGVEVVGTVTVDATNISIAWVKNGTLDGTAFMVWFAIK